MSQALIYTLLALALVLPFVGASALRVFFARLSDWQVVLLATVVFGTAIASVLVLARSNADSLRIGNLTLLLPVTAPLDVEVPLPTDLAGSPTRPPLPTVRSTPTAALTVTSTLSGTGTLTGTATLTPTIALTNTEAPPATLTATSIITPTVVPPTLAPTATLTPTVELASTPTVAPTPPPPAPRTYTVQPGDTLRSIAAQFNVSVADLLRANNLTPAQADSLRPGQVLTIP